MKVIIALVQVAIEVEDDSEGHSADTVSATLTENLKESGAILDWEYLQNEDDEYVYPISIGTLDTTNYSEGQAFDKTDHIRLTRNDI